MTASFEQSNSLSEKVDHSYTLLSITTLTGVLVYTDFRL